MRTFAQIPLSLWGQASFIALPDDARLALLYIWAGPHSESAGVSVLKDGYACVDLAWPADRWVKAREALDQAGLIARDQETETILAYDYFRANKPANSRHLTAIKNQIASVECPRLRELAEAALYQVRPELAPDYTPPTPESRKPGVSSHLLSLEEARRQAGKLGNGR